MKKDELVTVTIPAYALYAALLMTTTNSQKSIDEFLKKARIIEDIQFKVASYKTYNSVERAAKKYFGDLWWQIKWDESLVINLNDEYAAEILENTVKVGCQEFPIEKVKELYKAIKKAKKK